MSGTSLTGNRTSELPSVAAGEVKRGRRGPAPPIAVLFLAFCKEGGGVVKPSHPAMFHSSREALGSLVPLLPPLARSERSRATGCGGGSGAGGREEGGGAPSGGGGPRAPWRSSLLRARGRAVAVAAAAGAGAGHD